MISYPVSEINSLFLEKNQSCFNSTTVDFWKCPQNYLATAGWCRSHTLLYRLCKSRPAEPEKVLLKQVFVHTLVTCDVYNTHACATYDVRQEGLVKLGTTSKVYSKNKVDKNQKLFFVDTGRYIMMKHCQFRFIIVAVLQRLRKNIGINPEIKYIFYLL
jgi:hypothetical protein